jgi:anti-sigma factor RsiW
MTETHTISYQDLWDYLDGLLDTPEARRAVETALMRNEVLAAEFSLMRAQHRVLNQTPASVEREAVPERLLNVVRRARRAVAAGDAKAG